jgi:hypothetical protein
MRDPKQAKTMAKMPEDFGIGSSGVVAAIATAFQEAAPGAVKVHVFALGSITHG